MVSKIAAKMRHYTKNKSVWEMARHFWGYFCPASGLLIDKTTCVWHNYYMAEYAK